MEDAVLDMDGGDIGPEGRASREGLDLWYGPRVKERPPEEQDSSATD